MSYYLLIVVEITYWTNVFDFVFSQNLVSQFPEFIWVGSFFACGLLQDGPGLAFFHSKTENMG